MRIFENVSGQRMMTSYFRIGGVSLEPPMDFYGQVQNFLHMMPSKIDEYENLLTGNPIWMGRLKEVGYLSAADAIALGVTGPPLRASGVDWDLRRDMPYSGYERYQFAVPISERRRRLGPLHRPHAGDARVPQDLPAGPRHPQHPPRRPIVADAPKIVLPSREQMKTQMESLIVHFKLVTEGFAVPAGEVFQAVESPRGEMGYYVVSDGTAKPYRVHMRNPSYATLQALETMCKGRQLADVVAVIGSIDIVLGEIDR